MKKIVLALSFLVLFVSSAIAADTTIFFNGQSNPRGGGGPGGSHVWASNHFIWNNTNNTSSPDPVTFGDSYVVPNSANPPFHNGDNTYAIQFGTVLGEANPLDTVYQVLSAKGGQPFNVWMDEAGTPGNMYVRDANILDESGLPLPVDIWGHGQGENNDPFSGTGSNVDTPRAKLQAFPLYVDALEADGVIDSDTIILMMEAEKKYAHINAVTRVLAAQFDNAYLVPIRDFALAPGSDAHFDDDVVRDIGLLARDVYDAAVAGPVTPSSDRIIVNARSSAGQNLYSGNSSTYLTGFMPVDWNVEEVDSHDAFDGTVFHVPRDGTYDFRVLLSAIDQEYPAGSSFSASLFRLDDGDWIRDTSLGNFQVQGSVRTSPAITMAFTRYLEAGEKVWIGVRMNAPSGGFGSANPRLNSTAFVNWLTIQELAD